MPAKIKALTVETSEWLDIVDDTDTVIGRATRDEIHEKNLMHRSSHVVLFNSAGEVFVQLRSLLKDNSAGLWDTSAAGHVDSGESYLHCAVRELEEELGVSVKEADLSYVDCMVPESRNGFEFAQIYTICSDQQLTLQEEEIDDGRWMTPDALDAWIEKDAAVFTDTFLTIWSKVKPIGRLIV